MNTEKAQLLNDQEEAMRLMLEGWQTGIWTALPCIIVSVDLTKLTCVLQPAIQTVFEDENGKKAPATLPNLLDVPIVFPSGGGFIITFPLAAGDEVLGVFSSRCIDAWALLGGVQQAMESRMHDLSDCFAIPGPRSKPKLPGGAVSSTNLQIRNDVGTSYVEIDTSGKISLVSASEVDVIAPVATVTGAAINLNGAVTVTGNLITNALTCTGTTFLTGLGGVNVAGAMVVGGALSAATVDAGPVDLASHIHSGVQPGSGDTGPPV